MAVSTPQIAYIQTVLSMQGLAGSSFLTATVNNTGWQVDIPLRGVQASNVSAGPYLQVYEAVANAQGASPLFATVPMSSIAIANSASSDNTVILRLDTGYYCLQVGSGGPNTCTVSLLTAAVQTSILSL